MWVEHTNSSFITDVVIHAVREMIFGLWRVLRVENTPEMESMDINCVGNIYFNTESTGV